MAIDLNTAERHLGAVVLEQKPNRDDLDPAKLYLHHAPSSNGAGAEAARTSGKYFGWWGSKAAMGSTVDEVLERLEYPAR
jgi:hypothetical protein